MTLPKDFDVDINSGRVLSNQQKLLWKLSDPGYRAFACIRCAPGLTTGEVRQTFERVINSEPSLACRYKRVSGLKMPLRFPGPTAIEWSEVEMSAGSSDIVAAIQQAESQMLESR